MLISAGAYTCQAPSPSSSRQSAIKSQQGKSHRIRGASHHTSSPLQVVFNAEDAEQWKGAGLKVVLVRKETSPEDVKGMYSAEGVVTSLGGMTSHAAVVARGWGKPCITGCSALQVGAWWCCGRRCVLWCGVALCGAEWSLASCCIRRHVTPHWPVPQHRCSSLLACCPAAAAAQHNQIAVHSLLFCCCPAAAAAQAPCRPPSTSAHLLVTYSPYPAHTPPPHTSAHCLLTSAPPPPPPSPPHRWTRPTRWPASTATRSGRETGSPSTAAQVGRHHRLRLPAALAAAYHLRQPAAWLEDHPIRAHAGHC